MERLRVLTDFLKQPSVSCAVMNKFTEPQGSNYLRQLGYQKVRNLPFICYKPPDNAPLNSIPPSPQNKDKLLCYYILDTASLYPVLALDPQPTDTILDMCAAPGGKAFLLLQFLNSSKSGALALNDPSISRAKRLGKVIQQCVPKKPKHTIRITTRRGEEWGRIEEGVYDRVLVDAPCSSDRHNIKAWETKNKFYPEVESLKVLQHDLVLGAFHAVKSGGVVVYSTCTLSALENDAVVCRVTETAQRLGYKVTPSMDDNYVGTVFENCAVEETEYGRLIVPSSCYNIGPMYISKLLLIK